MRPFLAATGLVVFGGISAATTVLGAQRPDAVAPRTAVVAAVATAAPRVLASVPFTGGPDHPTRDDPAIVRRPIDVRDLLTPVAGRALPAAPELLPGSPRAYRAGIHEGMDFPAPQGTPVIAAADGTIVRIDTAFRELTADERGRILDDALRLGYTPAATLDAIRGRQVWIDHGRGVITRYAHLAAVEPIPAGSRVSAGERIGTVGSSGLPEGGPHLHFEVRIGDGYLGEDLGGDALLRAIDRAFR